MSIRITFEEWKNVFRNVEDINKELKAEGMEEEPLEVSWLEGDMMAGVGEEYVIHSGGDVIEDGFKTEQEGIDRLHEMEKRYYEYLEGLPKE